MNGATAHKPAMSIGDDAAVGITSADSWVSRGAYKLIGALDALSIDPAGRFALDAGSSTGGFTQVLLARGATRVAAVDVGTNQLSPVLAQDPRVVRFEQLNLRDIDETVAGNIWAQLGGRPSLVTADLSFISLTLVLPVLVRLAAIHAHLLVMVKPQFEVGKGNLGAHGVVRDWQQRRDSVQAVAQAAVELGWGIAGVTSSPLPGPAGNQEYFLHLTENGAQDDRAVHPAIAAAVQEETNEHAH